LLSRWPASSLIGYAFTSRGAHHASFRPLWPSANFPARPGFHDGFVPWYGPITSWYGAALVGAVEPVAGEISRAKFIPSAGTKLAASNPSAVAWEPLAGRLSLD